MTREIKYRVWSKKYNKYFELSDLHYEGDKIDGIFAISGTLAGIPHVIFLEPEDVVLEQDTGLKDKNGKEIYEGDIVKYKLYADSRLDYIDEVFYSTISGAFMVGDEDNIRTLDCLINVEVIGNIHENPELLEKGEE